MNQTQRKALEAFKAECVRRFMHGDTEGHSFKRFEVKTLDDTSISVSVEVGRRAMRALWRSYFAVSIYIFSSAHVVVIGHITETQNE